MDAYRSGGQGRVWVGLPGLSFPSVRWVPTTLATSHPILGERRGLRTGGSKPRNPGAYQAVLGVSTEVTGPGLPR